MNKIGIMLRLRKLRMDIEAGQDRALTEEQATLLTDVCQALEITNDSEIYYVVGEGFASFIDAPVPYRPTGATAFAMAFAQQAAAGGYAVTIAGDKVTLEKATE